MARNHSQLWPQLPAAGIRPRATHPSIGDAARNLSANKPARSRRGGGVSICEELGGPHSPSTPPESSGHWITRRRSCSCHFLLRHTTALKCRGRVSTHAPREPRDDEAECVAGTKPETRRREPRPPHSAQSSLIVCINRLRLDCVVHRMRPTGARVTLLLQTQGLSAPTQAASPTSLGSCKCER